MKHKIKVVLAVFSIFLLTSCDQVDELKQSTDDLFQQTMDRADEVIQESKERVKAATDTILNDSSDPAPNAEGDSTESADPAELPEEGAENKQN